MLKRNKSEFELIRKIIKKLPGTHPDVIIGAGDDTGVIKMPDGNYLLATTDSQVDGVHFLSKIAKPLDIGSKSIAVNVSDIAAMGGIPTFCLVSLILPKILNDDYVDKLYDGIIKECKRYDIQIIGGNISAGKELVVDIFMLGKTTPDQLLLRRGAKPGDIILVTGDFGGASGGLQLLLDPKLEVSAGNRKILLLRQFIPTPRIKEAQVIAGLKLATSMIDVSDGLGADLGHVCESSKVGARIFEEKIPISDAVREIAGKTGRNLWELAVNGGEDYELMFTAPKSTVDSIISSVKQETGTDVTVIGEILPETEGKWLALKNGKTIQLPVEGWDHFRA